MTFLEHARRNECIMIFYFWQMVFSKAKGINCVFFFILSDIIGEMEYYGFASAMLQHRSKW